MEEKSKTFRAWKVLFGNPIYQSSCTKVRGGKKKPESCWKLQQQRLNEQWKCTSQSCVSTRFVLSPLSSAFFCAFFPSPPCTVRCFCLFPLPAFQQSLQNYNCTKGLSSFSIKQEVEWKKNRTRKCTVRRTSFVLVALFSLILFFIHSPPFECISRTTFWQWRFFNLLLRFPFHSFFCFGAKNKTGTFWVGLCE